MKNYMDPLEQVKLQSVMTISTGIPELVIRLIDGPIDFGHGAFQSSNISTARNLTLPNPTSPPALMLLST